MGVLDDVLTNVDNVIRKGRLGPGQTVVADLSSGTFKENTQIAKEVGSREPYEQWLSSSTRLKDLGASGYSKECLLQSSEVRLPWHSQAYLQPDQQKSVTFCNSWASIDSGSSPLHLRGAYL